MKAEDKIIKHLAYQEDWEDIKDKDSPFTLDGVRHLMELYANEKVIEAFEFMLSGKGKSYAQLINQYCKENNIDYQIN